MIVISDDVVLSETLQQQGIDGRNPRIGWHNLVTEANISADEEASGHPASYMGIPATYLYWKGETNSAQTVTVALGSAQTVNYMALARHNLGTIGAEYVIESSTDGDSWDELTDARVLPNDHSLIHEFEDTFASFFRISLASGSAPPEIGVMYLGEILRLQRRIYVGHTPLTFGRRSTVTTNYSEDGQFLGRIVQARAYESSVSLQNITPSWYRSHLDPFFHEAVESPFFIAWRPATYPTETGYVWLRGDASMQNQRANGMISAEFSFEGIR